MDRALTSPVCRGCGQQLTELLLDLGMQPSAEDFPGRHSAPEELFPLQLWQCGTCLLVQLGPTVFGADPPVVAESRTGRDHARRSIARVMSDHGIPQGAVVREFPSPHGTPWLGHAEAAGLVPAVVGFTADLVLDAHGLLHDDQLHDSLTRRAAALGEDGVLLLEFHHLLSLVQNGQFDMVRHGHTMYFSLLAVRPALERHGLRVVHAEQVPVYGGSLQLTVTRHGDADPSVPEVERLERAAGLDDPDRLRRLQSAARLAGDGLRNWLVEVKARGETVAGYGAPSKASTLLCGSRIGPDLLPFTVDLSAAKHGRLIPGCRVPIRSVDALYETRPDYVVLLVWDLAEEIRTQLADLERSGVRFVVPIPEIRILDSPVVTVEAG